MQKHPQVHITEVFNCLKKRFMTIVGFTTPETLYGYSISERGPRTIFVISLSPEQQKIRYTNRYVKCDVKQNSYKERNNH